MPARPISHWTLLGSLGTGLAIVLGLSGSCDKAIEQKALVTEKLEAAKHLDHEGRLKRLEAWQDVEAHKP